MTLKQVLRARRRELGANPYTGSEGLWCGGIDRDQLGERSLQTEALRDPDKSRLRLVGLYAGGTISRRG